jgi:glycosyltransferase involved in cell wall biosynthesis
MNLFLENYPNNTNILIVIDSLDGGGAESQVLMLAHGLMEKGINTSVFTLRGGGKLVKKAKSLNLHIIEGDLKSKRDLKSLILSFIFLCKTIRKYNPCIVHTFLPLSNFLGSIGGRLSGAKYVITSRRGQIKLNYLKKRWRFIDRVSNFCSNIVTVNSHAIKDEMKEIDSIKLEKIICIRNGLDLNKFKIKKIIRNEIRESLNIKESDFAWIKVANFSSIKGHEDLIRGFAEIDRSYSGKLFFVGKDNGALVKLTKIVKDLKLEQRIKFLGFQEDIPKILSAMDGYICASHTEGFSNAILEAMASQLPIIATKVGGNPEILENGRYGLLIEPNNEKDICKSMEMIMEDTCLRESLSSSCLKVVKDKYSKESMINNHINIYNKGIS